MKVQTVGDVEREVERIAAMADDDESAHIAEDSLYVQTLHAISTSSDQWAAEMARAALKAYDIVFSRWYA